MFKNVREMAHLLYFRAGIPKATSISNPSPPVLCDKPASPRPQNLSTCQFREIITHYHSTMLWWQQSRVRNTTTSVQTPWIQQLSSATLAGHLASHIRYATAGWKDSFNAWCRLETTWWILNVSPQKVDIFSAGSTNFCIFVWTQNTRVVWKNPTGINTHIPFSIILKKFYTVSRFICMYT